MSSGRGASLTWLKTAPPFWARPAMSIMPQPLPSRCAAMPRMAPMVTTPVPPTPVTITAKLRPRAVDGDEGRAEALHAGEVLVAVRLVDLALAAELGLERLHGDAVRLHAAIAAALADQLVDEDALVGIGIG